MKRYIHRSWLCWLGWAALASGIILQVASTGTINGAALIPLPLIYAAYRLRGNEKAASRLPSESGTSKNTLI